MSTESLIAARREQLLERLFPAGVPDLWCPALTFYDADGVIDGSRIAAHLDHISAHVKGLLIPGSTGEGWELTDEETGKLLEIALDQAQRLNLHLLIGALKHDAAGSLGMIRATVDRIKVRTNEGDARAALAKARVVGFTICPPRGKDLTQKEICAALEAVLQEGLPTAIYQLPQVTQNEIGAELAFDLARRFGNFILLKDTSGEDRVVSSGLDLAGVFTVRGAEGDYARQLKAAGGLYDGFLLSTANCFARELRQLIQDVSDKRLDKARELSERLTAIVSEAFQVVTGLPAGNPFANANKAIDHCLAYGAKALGAPLPRLHGGVPLPAGVIRSTAEILSRHGFMPARGYLG